MTHLHPLRQVINLLSIIVALGLCILSGSMVASAQNINLQGNQSLTINTGNKYENVITSDTSHVTMLGGQVFYMVMFNQSTLTMTGGTITSLISVDDTAVNIGGGTISFYISGEQSDVNITGGIFSGVSLESHLPGSITGGTFTNFYGGVGDVSITGGTFGTLHSLGQRNITLTGFDFILTGGTPGTYSNNINVFNGLFYTLTGRLFNNPTVGSYTLFEGANRTAISTGITTVLPGAFILNDLGNGKTIVVSANGTAAAPEPGTLALLSLTVMLLAWRFLTKLTATEFTLEG